MIVPATSDDIKFFSEVVHYDPSVKAKGVVYKMQRRIMAMVLYDHWAYNSAHVHIYSASPKALFDKKFIHEIFAYPFVTCDRGVLIATTPADQEASLAVSKALGFNEILRVKDGWKVGIDMIVKEMRRENCQWLERKAA